jgi:hypothetical protein
MRCAKVDFHYDEPAAHAFLEMLLSCQRLDEGRSCSEQADALSDGVYEDVKAHYWNDVRESDVVSRVCLSLLKKLRVITLRRAILRQHVDLDSPSSAVLSYSHDKRLWDWLDAFTLAFISATDSNSPAPDCPLLRGSLGKLAIILRANPAVVARWTQHARISLEKSQRMTDDNVLRMLLLVAVRHGQVESLQHLLAWRNHHAQSVTGADDFRYTPEELSAIGGMMRLPYRCRSESNTVKRVTLLCVACHVGRVDIVDNLILVGRADVNACFGAPLCLASQNGNLDVVRVLLERHGADVDGSKGMCASLACARGHADTAVYLIAHLALQLPPTQGCLAKGQTLVRATIDKRLDIMRLMLEAGARPDFSTQLPLRILVIERQKYGERRRNGATTGENDERADKYTRHVLDAGVALLIHDKQNGYFPACVSSTTHMACQVVAAPACCLTGCCCCLCCWECRDDGGSDDDGSDDGDDEDVTLASLFDIQDQDLGLFGLDGKCTDKPMDVLMDVTESTICFCPTLLSLFACVPCIFPRVMTATIRHKWT